MSRKTAISKPATTTVAPRARTLRFGAFEATHVLLPVLLPGAEPSRSSPLAIDISFTGHPGALVRHRSGRVLIIAVPPGSGGTTSADPLDWEGVPEPAECVEIRPDGALRRASAEALGDASWADFPQVTGIRDAALFAVASRIRAAARGGEPMEELEADALAELLVRHMIRRVFRLPRERATEARLDPLRLDKVDALIGDRLSEPLRLDALASEAGLSRWHFFRVFRRTTGLSPAAYLAARRAEAARALLTDTPMPVAAVARAVGYANVHHFRRVFVRHHGASPTEVRSSFASRRVRMPSSMD